MHSALGIQSIHLWLKDKLHPVESSDLLPEHAIFTEHQIKASDMTAAEIISIGDELLIGQTVNTNASWLGQQFSLSGIRVMHTAVISDERQAIIDAIDAALKRTSIVVITGGLGPTKDDITKHVLCEYFTTQLVLNSEVLAHVESFFIKRGRPMLEVNTLQAYVPASCEVLFNEEGTAPGMWFEQDGKIVVSMPGVPYEMKSIFMKEALPRIAGRFKTASLYHQTVMTQGIGESFLADKMSGWEERLRDEDLALAYLPSPGMVKLRITSMKGVQEAGLIEQYIREVESELPLYAYGRNEVTLSEVVGKLLADREETVGTVESCTSGALLSGLTAVPGASVYVMGGLGTYSNELKTKLAGVDPVLIDRYGAVSEETAVAMAAGGRKVLGTDWCIATTGIAGPSGGSDEKPVGLVWIAIAGPDGVSARQFLFGTDRGRNIQMSVLSGLNMLRCRILGIFPEKNKG